MYYIYTLYSEPSNLYYVGYSTDPARRLTEPNTKPFFAFTSKYRPWILKAIFQCGEDEGEAIRIERFIKQQKSRKFIEKIITPDFEFEGILAQLVRVPMLRD